MDLHAVVAAGKQIFHTILSASGWQSIGDVNGQIGSVDRTIFPADQVESQDPNALRPGSVGGVSAVAVASLASKLHVFALCDFLTTTIRRGDGSWTQWVGIAAPDTFKGFHLLASAVVGSEVHVFVGGAKTVLHGTRRADATWTDFRALPVTLPPSITSIACACVGAQLHFVAVGSGQVLHTILFRDGTWQPSGDVLGQIGPIAGVQTVTACGRLGELEMVLGGTRLVHVTRHASGSWTPRPEDLEYSAGNPGALQHLAMGHVDNRLHLLVHSAGSFLHTSKSEALQRSPRAWKRFDDLWSFINGPRPVPSITAVSAYGLARPPAFEIETSGMNPFLNSILTNKISSSLSKAATGSLATLLKNPVAAAETLQLFGETWTRIGVFLHNEPSASLPFLLDESPGALSETSLRIPIETFEDILTAVWTDKTGRADGIYSKTYNSGVDDNTLLELKVHRPTVWASANPPTIGFDAVVDGSQPGGVTFQAVGHHKVVFHVEDASVGIGAAAETLSVVKTAESDSFDAPDSLRAALSGIDFLAFGAFHPGAQVILESAAQIILSTYSPDFGISVGGQVDGLFYPKIYLPGGSKITLSYGSPSANDLGLVVAVQLQLKKRKPGLTIYRPVEFVKGQFQVTCEVDDMLLPSFVWKANTTDLVAVGTPTNESAAGGLHRRSTATFRINTRKVESFSVTVTVTDQDIGAPAGVVSGSVALEAPHAPPVPVGPPRPLRPR